jgi:hypothetical protein
MLIESIRRSSLLMNAGFRFAGVNQTLTVFERIEDGATARVLLYTDGRIEIREYLRAISSDGDVSESCVDTYEVSELELKLYLGVS